MAVKKSYQCARSGEEKLSIMQMQPSSVVHPSISHSFNPQIKRFKKRANMRPSSTHGPLENVVKGEHVILVVALRSSSAISLIPQRDGWEALPVRLS